MRWLFSSATVTVLVLLAVLSIAFIGSHAATELLRASYETEREIRIAQVVNAQVLTFQFDEAAAIRGFASSGGRRGFLDSYETAKRQFALSTERLQAKMNRLDGAGVDALRTILELNAMWRQSVVAPTIADPKHSDFQAVRGKTLVERIGNASKQIDERLEERSKGARGEIARALGRITFWSTASVIILGGAALFIGFQRSRFRAALQQEQATVAILQQGFINRWDSLPGTDVGAVYVSATRGALVGGDLFDVHRIDDRLGYVLIADVSGKGVEAAIDTAFIKYSIRGLTAVATNSPATILRHLARLLDGHLSNPDGFVVLFLGILDFRALTLTYSSAGHAGAFLRRGSTVVQLEVTGPVIGLNLGPDSAPASGERLFTTQHLGLQKGDVLLLATDGLTEARNVERVMLTDEGAMRWFGELPAGAPAQGTANSLVARLRRYVQGELRDDLAVLVLRMC